MKNPPYPYPPAGIGVGAGDVSVGVGTGIGDDRGEEVGAVVGTGEGEASWDALGASGSLDGEEQTRITSNETDAASRVKVWFMTFISF